MDRLAAPGRRTEKDGVVISPYRSLLNSERLLPLTLRCSSNSGRIAQATALREKLNPGRGFRYVIRCSRDQCSCFTWTTSTPRRPVYKLFVPPFKDSDVQAESMDSITTNNNDN